jgi:hypothetical protein
MAAFRVEAADERLAEPRLEAINRFPVLEIADVVFQPCRLSRVGNTDEQGPALTIEEGADRLYARPE